MSEPTAMELEQITFYHCTAMLWVDYAAAWRRKGDWEKSADCWRSAFATERKAAEMVTNYDLEPTRSILHRSAAALALECGEIAEAERLIAAGLAGNPPEEIAEELREIMRGLTKGKRDE